MRRGSNDESEYTRHVPSILHKSTDSFEYHVRKWMDDASKETSDASVFFWKRIRIFVRTIELCIFFLSPSFHSFFFEVHRISLFYNLIFIDRSDTFYKIVRHNCTFLHKVWKVKRWRGKVIRLVNSLALNKAFSFKFEQEVVRIKSIIVWNSSSQEYFKLCFTLSSPFAKFTVTTSDQF